MSDGKLTPAWARWAEMAGAAVIRHMDGGPLVPVPYVVAANATQRENSRRANRDRRRRQASRPMPDLSPTEKQVLAGIEMEMTHGQIAKNLRVREVEIEDAVRMLRKRGLL
jgi:DNA-binding CsgD family transcriptional regulator